MNVLTVVMALLSAVFNAAASVLQRRAAVEPDEVSAHGARGATARLAGLLRRPYWWGGISAMGLSAVFQVIALDSGGLAVVQPLLASELLFTLLIGAAVFRHRPGAGTWWDFLMLAGGLALFLLAASPSQGGDRAGDWKWLGAGGALACGVALLLALALRIRGPLQAAALGLATAACFSVTAALIKEVTARFPDGFTAVLTTWHTYAGAATGLLSVLLLQWTLRAGTLAASQPALTLGDALISVVLGGLLFGENIAAGWHVLPEVAGVGLMALGIVGLTRSPAVASGNWDEVPEHRPDVRSR
ncbi:DMT family transporter [Actinacidiphila acididurans]|uniref:DMT family transporter n=1 Tax=Actinacidiphila acididurans TaxID=2784346 RepID=A0ABS2TTM2_9ACTN|nr:DMT family transporter [Actinacidiphila acididurans]MBM9506167.1 DMT family transporter [Actinacidiphila acididurans]